MRIAVIDVLGLCYDGDTLNRRGLGGSESAVILMTKELVRLGMEVVVFNDCISDDSRPGNYDGVIYKPLSQVENDYVFDIMIASRSIVAFAPDHIREQFKTFLKIPNFKKIKQGSKHKILWMHDTFCDGDDLIEDLVVSGHINEIFTLSDFHTNYITNCTHGRRRNFEVLKKHIFETRNGIGKYNGWVDIRDKDPDLFVYNASVTKGMIPLVEKIWPRIKKQIPQAKLKIIGGYYRFRTEHGPDEQEKKWHQMVAANPDIEFTGIITQKEIADILTQASYMVYPSAFPETYGISSLESLNYNTPIITCNFGALEETAVDLMCYKIPYAIEPNSLFPHINAADQETRFVDVAVQAWRDKYLHQQKMYACNQVKDISGWDSVALQWKQHFYEISGNFLPVEEYRKVSDINYKVRKVFGRRFLNLEELREPRNEQLGLRIITPVYNAENYIDKCILSVAQQDYDNYCMIIIDDASTDNTLKVIEDTLLKIGSPVRDKIVVVKNTENVGAVKNQISTIKRYTDVWEDDDIIMLLDGDDWLINNPNIFHKYNNIYRENTEFTYGSCWSLADNIPLIAQEYPPEVKKNGTYREYSFNWNIPYSHLRTFRYKLTYSLHEAMFKDEDGNWLRAGGDTAVFYNLIEKAFYPNVKCIPDIVYNYNDLNPINDYKVNSEEQTKTSTHVQNNKPNLVFDLRRL